MRFRLALVIVTGAALLVAWRLVGPLALSLPGAALCSLVVALVFGATMLVPIGWMSSGRLGAFARVRSVRWVAYMSMAFLSVLVALLLARDAIALGFHLLALAGVDVDAARVEHLGSLVVPPLALLITAWGWLSVRRGARTVEVKVPIAGLPAPFAGFRIVQLSDIHIGETVRRPHIEAMVDRVNALDADLVAITGDLVDGPVSHLAEHAAPLARLTSRHGTYFALGNHDHYSGARSWAEHLDALGMDVLVNRHRVIEKDGHAIAILGVDDLSATDDPHADVRRALRGTPDGVRILLAHHPRSAIAAMKEKIHLQLSGHTHGGQFLPWNFVAPVVHGFTAGLQKVGAMWLYVSRGTFYWGPPVRILAPAEITVLVLEPGSSS